MKRISLFCAGLFVIVICGSCNSNPSATEKQTTATGDSSANVPAAENKQAVPASDEKAKISFKVNGIEARTSKGADNDREAQAGLLNVSNMNLSLDLLGDDPARPHRGWLHFSLNNFKTEPATYTINDKNEARFSRYETANAGGAVDYNASNLPMYKGSEMTIQFTDIHKNEAAQFGEEYLASGTFSAKMMLMQGYNSDQKTIEITAGKFEQVPISVLGKKK